MGKRGTPCRTCGGVVRGRGRRYCSTACDPKCAADECDRVVETRQGYCLMHWKRWKRWGDPAGAPIPACSACGIALKRKSPNGPLAKECGDCSRQRTELALYGHVLTATRICKFCSREFQRKGTNRVWCSPICRARGAEGAVPVDACIECGDPIDFFAVSAKGRTKRVDATTCGRCRRDVRYGATVAELIDRDGSVCSLCGEDVDLALKWPHRMSATRDHVVPYSKGGSNDAANLALAHAVCNARKRDRYVSLKPSLASRVGGAPPPSR